MPYQSLRSFSSKLAKQILVTNNLGFCLGFCASVNCVLYQQGQKNERVHEKVTRCLHYRYHGASADKIGYDDRKWSRNFQSPNLAAHFMKLDE